MRYRSISYLQEGMVLARAIRGINFEVLMGKGASIKPLHIKHLNDLGYAGAYVFDAGSDNIEAEDIIPDELRIKAIKAAKNMLAYAEESLSRQTGSRNSKDIQLQIVMPVVDSIIARRNRIVDLIDIKPFENYRYYHAANVMALSLLVGVEMGIAGAQLYDLGLAALLHDVGDIFVPNEILQKAGKLTAEEYDIVKQHSERGFDFLRGNVDFPIDACIGVFHHHEKYDGTGYPNNLKNKKISLAGRIIALTEVFDALISRRPFRDPMYPPEALEFIRYHSGAMFDPDAVKALRQIIPLYPAGVCVELSSKVQCLVVRNYAQALERPPFAPGQLHEQNAAAYRPV